MRIQLTDSDWQKGITYLAEQAESLAEMGYTITGVTLEPKVEPCCSIRVVVGMCQEHQKERLKIKPSQNINDLPSYKNKEFCTLLEKWHKELNEELLARP